MGTFAKQVDFLLNGYRDPTTDVILSGGKVTTKLAGTSTESALWTDRAKSAQATNPIILGSDGTAEVYGDNIYDFVITDSDDASVDTLSGLDYRTLSGESLASIGLLRDVDGGTGDVIFLTGRASLGDGGGGNFYWNATDLSGSVTIDTESGIFVAPTSDITGASGCWVRSYFSGSPIRTTWFGAGISVDDNSVPINAAAVFVESVHGGGEIVSPTGLMLTTNGIDIPQGVTLSGEGFTQASTFTSDVGGSVIKANAAMAYVVKTTTAGASRGGACLREIAIDGNDVATATVVRTGLSDRLSNVHLLRGATYCLHEDSAQAVGGMYADRVYILANGGTGIYAEVGSDQKYNGLVIAGAHTGLHVKTGGIQVTDFHIYPAPLAVDNASLDAHIKIDGASDGYYCNGHLDNLSLAGSAQLKILTTAASESCVENRFVNVSFDNPSMTVNGTVSSVILDNSLGTNTFITAQFVNVQFDSDATNKLKYAFEKTGTASRIDYSVVNATVNNYAALWSHAPDFYVGIKGVSGAVTAIEELAIKGGEATFDKTYTGSLGIQTIASGVVTVTRNYEIVDTEAAAATDDLDTINGGEIGMELTLSSNDSAREVTVKDGTGNLHLAGDFLLSHIWDTITLIYTGPTNGWLEKGRSDNQT